MRLQKAMRYYSIIIPVYNRPDEVEELLESLTKQTYVHFEVVVVEDGSTKPCQTVVEHYKERLDIRYFAIANSGPGGARNFGAGQSRGEYLLILDSDCLLPACYVEQVHESLKRWPSDAFGGPDRAHASFTPIQKAINYAMTSFFTTGGIRGGKRKLDAFYPRSFNMGIRREVYRALGGFSEMRYGEDIDFSIRIRKGGYTTRLFPAAYVFHKRRSTFGQFFRQVHHSGEARIALHRKHPGTLRPVHCLPAVFVAGLTLSVALMPLAPALPGIIFLPYAALLGVDAFLRNDRSVRIALLSVCASFIQLVGYGTGFLRAACRRTIKQ